MLVKNTRARARSAGEKSLQMYRNNAGLRLSLKANGMTNEAEPSKPVLLGLIRWTSMSF